MSSACLPKLVWHMDEPLADTAFITTFLVSEFARQDVKVILSGLVATSSSAATAATLAVTMPCAIAPAGMAARSARLRCRRLPADRHSGVLNTLRLAKGFSGSQPR
jgi:asparagine synthase (glutamine-hydrolysing)